MESTRSKSSRTTITVALCCLAALAEGFDIQSMGVAAPTLAPALRLSREALGPVFSASTVGLLIGAVALGRLADRIGRRATLILSLFVFGLFSLATAAAWSVPSLLAIRLLAGLGLGGAMPNFVALSAEAVNEAWRGRIVALCASAMPFGGAVASAVAAGWDWRAIFLVGGAAPLAIAALMTVLLPESAAFLASRRSEATPATSLSHVYFAGARAPATLMLWTAAFAMLLSLYLILNWLPTLMGTKGASRSEAALVSLMFNIGGGLGALILAATFRPGRRAVILGIWFAGMAVALVGLALTGPALLVAAPVGLAAGVFVSAAPTALYALAPDYYAVEMRGAGVGSVIGFGRLGAILGPLLAGALITRGADADAVLLALLPFAAIAAAATFMLLARPAVASATAPA